ncbi:phytanoyl-CoA dioxygenase family protein [Paenibacillus frigoriresistens]|uniref:phytanoyl-CoA dioxygenase family protein n=1 Tax=Paenibacillus alginolyticus TaxID=59839 RepID=UPI001566546D|nr:phytanoyl-CoA dioxygenase family protein [Paenibacillus frigoriresistens]NRF90385.1 phytanoyl-CoA dioxygenase family protein [Paenibacillus frigoriresistens]
MKLSPEELSDGVLKKETIASAVEQIRLNGYVYFESVLPHELVDEMHASFLNLFHEKSKTSPDETEVNAAHFRKNRTRLFLPFEKPFTDPQVLTSPFILPIIEEILGKDCIVTYLAVDAPLPGSDYQAVHSDTTALYPDVTVNLPPQGLTLNIALVDVTEENGPMEVWPTGTHLTPENLNKPEHVQKVSKLSEPHRVMLPKGSLLIRDPRMWHRGTPNNSDHIRPIVALSYARYWWRGYYQNTLAIKEEVYKTFSERAKQLVRYEEIVSASSGPVQIRIPGEVKYISLLDEKNKNNTI